MTRVRFQIEPVPPFRLDLTVWALRRRPDNLVDRWDGRTYRRVLTLGNAPVAIGASQEGPPEAARLNVTATTASATPDVERAVVGRLERMLGLRIELSEFYACAALDPMLGPLANRLRGLKPPRFPTLFETLTNAIACQQITLTQGIRLLNRLVERRGEASPEPTDTGRAFPQPADLAWTSPDDLREWGYSRQKALALVDLSRAIETDVLDLDATAQMDDAGAVRRLQELRGVGRWTAEYALLRGLGRLNVFPGDDVGARNNLQRWLGLPGPLGYQEVQRTLEPWQPFQGLVYLHLLVDRLATMGYVEP